VQAIRDWGLILLIIVAAGCASTGTDGRHTKPNSSATVDSSAQRCVALAMYWEAGGEGRRGMAAVGSVIMNRVADRRFPNTPCEVVFQGGEKPPCQFSWWCDGKSDRPTNESIWALARSTAQELLAARLPDATNGALFFHSTSIRSPWRRQKTAQIGNHIFYR
jgi:spore germination cell wall hydrolase CwlJ-like protein